MAFSISTLTFQPRNTWHVFEVGTDNRLVVLHAIFVVDETDDLAELGMLWQFLFLGTRWLEEMLLEYMAMPDPVPVSRTFTTNWFELEFTNLAVYHAPIDAAEAAEIDERLAVWPAPDAPLELPEGRTSDDIRVIMELFVSTHGIAWQFNHPVPVPAPGAASEE